MYYFQNLLQTPPPDTELTQRPQGAQTTVPIPQRCHGAMLTPNRGVVFMHVEHVRRRMAFYANQGKSPYDQQCQYQGGYTYVGAIFYYNKHKNVTKNFIFNVLFFL